MTADEVNEAEKMNQEMVQTGVPASKSLVPFLSEHFKKKHFSKWARFISIKSGIHFIERTTTAIYVIKELDILPVEYMNLIASK